MIAFEYPPQLVRGRQIYPPGHTIRIESEVLLQSLGTTPRQVYRSLKKRDIHGSPGPCHCPVAVYLQQRLPGIYVAVCNRDLWIGSTPIVLPEAVAGFIRKFDRGGYRGVHSGIA